ncbi:MAG: MoaD/ThiS family protein [Ferruginibacter sp.]
MKVNVEIFGQLTEITKNKYFEFTSVNDTDSLLQKIYEQFPGLQSASFVIAVNNNLIKHNTLLQDNNTVALMPPYSGG